MVKAAIGKREPEDDEEEDEEDFSSFDCQVFRDYMEVDYRCKWDGMRLTVDLV